jgi:hypothetical protein
MDLGLVSAGAGLVGATIALPRLSLVLGSFINRKFARNSFAKTGCAVRTFTRSLFRGPRGAMLMRFKTKSRTFRCWSFFMVRSV